jgi:hypothetical protein
MNRDLAVKNGGIFLMLPVMLLSWGAVIKR